MLKAIPIKQPKPLDESDSPALQNPAIALCAAAWEITFQPALAKTKNKYEAANQAGHAFRQAMPPLYGYQNICDFIACAGYGILIGAIESDAGSKLLYAAQVALTAIPQQARSHDRTQTRREPAPAFSPERTPTPSPTFAPTPTKQES